MTNLGPPPANRDDFEIAIICALPEERDTVEALMTRDFKSEGKTYGKVQNDDNIYTTGVLGNKPVVLVAPRAMGTTNTRDLARGLKISFQKISWAFVVGIAGGAPFVPDGSGWKDSGIQLGDVVISTQVIEYDFGREYENGFKRRTDVESVLPRAPPEVANFINLIKLGRSAAFRRILAKTNADLTSYSNLQTGKGEYPEHPGANADHVYALGYRHKHQDPGACTKCSQCTEWYHEVCATALTADCLTLGCKPQHSNNDRIETKIHFGRYASGNAVMKSGHRRDLLIRDEKVIAFEMEGAGAWEVFGTIVVKGIVDYADSHKNKKWRGCPAARAALCAAAMIEEIELPEKPPNILQRDTPQQLWLLPRQANTRYTGYTDVLERLQKCILPQDDGRDSTQVVFVLSGMGGVGKSETVLQFVSKNEKALRQKFWAVLWVDNSSEIATRADFKRIGTLCGWPLDDTDTLYGVKDRLASLTTSTLLILDNCDDTETDYSRCIPNGTRVSVILTTRLSDAGKYATVDSQGQPGKLFHRLRGLDEDSAVKLLLNASEVQERGQHAHEQARQIGIALEHHPLALTIASSLIRSRMYSLEEYANALGSRLAQKELLDTKSEQARYQKLSATFEVSAERLQRKAAADPSAKRALALLDVLGFMHHKGVAEEIFVRAWTYEEELLSKWIEDDGDDFDVLLSRYNNGEWHDDDSYDLSPRHIAHSRSVFPWAPPGERKQSFRAARFHLERLSLVTVDAAGSSISLHHTADSAHTVGVSEYILELSLKCKLPQANILRAQRLLGTANGVDRRFPEAIEILERAERSHKEACPEYHEVGASIRHARGQAYHDQGQISKALDKLEYTVKAQTKLQNLDLLAIQHELGRAYLANGQTSAAIETLKHVVKSEEMLPESDPDRLSSQHALGSALYEKGQIPEAIEIGEHVVNVRRESLPEDDRARLASEHNLAMSYLNDGQISKAIEMLTHVVRVEEMLPELPPDRLESHRGLARAYQSNEQINAAMAVTYMVHAVLEAALPTDHADLRAAEDCMTEMAHIHASTDAGSHQTEQMVSPGIALMLERVRARTISAERTSGDASSITTEDSLVEIALHKASILEEARARVISAEETSGLKLGREPIPQQVFASLWRRMKTALRLQERD
ncbi:unnamed protein product [Zymoseptoria tritici ST99CH_1E4]|uniref:Uncharacterized protein n=1 Tax=Zymoseptoria tritici ST99CH_1E4 TaxID=1276532 RepID=A0A2H1GXV2_ZYMTR|nr:unnamed protein product [Zymoseptoria tritici ST99CH_1E4]